MQEHAVERLLLAEDAVHPRGVRRTEGHDLAEDELTTRLEHPHDLDACARDAGTGA